MPPLVRSLLVKGFRSLANVRIDFDNPTFLVGRNGSGKSNIGDALRFIAEAMNAPLKEVIDRRGGVSAVRTKFARKGFPKNLGLGIVGGPWQDLLDLGVRVQSAENASLSWGVESFRYSFEIGPVADYDIEILREQCVVRYKDGTRKWFERHNDGIRSNILEPMKFVQKAYLALPIFAGASELEFIYQILSRMKVYSISPVSLREMQDPESGRELRTDGRNAASVFEEIQKRSPEDIRRIKEILAAIVPYTTVVDTVQHREKVAFEFAQRWGDREKLTFEAYSMSDGTLRALGLLLAVYQVQKPSLIFVEEPESSIHPGAAAALLDTLRFASSMMQVVVSTHSPSILDAKWIEDRNIRAVLWQEGATLVEEIPQHAKSALRNHLMGAGELLRSEALEVSRTEKLRSHPDVELFEDNDGGTAPR
jgi:predicted ATPase